MVIYALCNGRGKVKDISCRERKREKKEICVCTSVSKSVTNIYFKHGNVYKYMNKADNGYREDL